VGEGERPFSHSPSFAGEGQKASFPSPSLARGGEKASIFRIFMCGIFTQIYGPIWDFHILDFYVQDFYVWEKFVAPLYFSFSQLKPILIFC
jgi:hypothetical protein